MESVRLRRLKSDHEVLRRLANRHPKIEIEGVSGNPPDRYRIKMRVRSLREKGEQIEVAETHRLEITLPRGYPRDAPLFRMLTPVFHPNIAPHAVCIGDHWTASEQLDTLVQRVGEILAFQSYNIKSPLNGRAAQWVDENQSRLPLDREEFFVDMAQAEPPQSSEAYRANTTCANCGTTAGEMRTCAKGHTACRDCTLHCGQCGKSQCLTCGEHKNHVCPNAATACRNCGKAATGLVCNEWHTLCDDCGVACRTCGEVGCVVCGNIPCRTCATRAMAPA